MGDQNNGFTGFIAHYDNGTSIKETYGPDCNWTRIPKLGITSIELKFNGDTKLVVSNKRHYYFAKRTRVSMSYNPGTGEFVSSSPLDCRARRLGWIDPDTKLLYFNEMDMNSGNVSESRSKQYNGPITEAAF